MYTLSAADFADTGQWRLLLEISNTGLRAHLENTLHPEIGLQRMCETSWEINRDRLRDNIEEAVYNNPRLLDDFATRIVMYDPRTLFIPTEIAEESAGYEEELYQKIYPAETSDIMTDCDNDITAVWAMAPGIKSFLMRTFPGARITCHLFDKIRELRKNNEGLGLYIQARQKGADLILLDNENLISASTHELNHPDDLAYLALNLLEVYDKKPEETSLYLANVAADTEAWKYIESRSRDFHQK